MLLAVVDDAVVLVMVTLVLVAVTVVERGSSVTCLGLSTTSSESRSVSSRYTDTGTQQMSEMRWMCAEKIDNQLNKCRVSPTTTITFVNVNNI